MIFAVPSCYIATNCTGEPINGSISFAECCSNFGVSYDLDGRCQPCPTTRLSEFMHNIMYVVACYNYHTLLYFYQCIIMLHSQPNN